MAEADGSPNAGVVRDLDACATATALRQELAVHPRSTGRDRTLLTALFADGHALLVGVPGLAKTLIVRLLAQALGLSFSRIHSPGPDAL